MQSHEEAHLSKGTARLAYLSQPKGENIGKLTRLWTRSIQLHHIGEGESEAGRPAVPSTVGMRMNITGREGLKYMDAVTAPYSR